MKRIEQYVLNPAVDGGDGADAERERKNGQDVEGYLS